jgi:protein arginine N-methyltransferase 1
MEAYSRALRGAIRPGAVVMDIGTGPGVIAVLACQFGASRVYAIESSEVIQVAREIAVANNCSDKIEFFEDLSTKVSIAVKADVIVSDMRGVLPLFQAHIPSIADARARFLAPGGKLIARKDTIWAAIVEAPEQYEHIVGPWERNSWGQNLDLARRKVLSEFQKVRLSPEALLTGPCVWATLDYATIENPDVSGILHWTARRGGTGHGILVWFDMDLAEGVAFSNGPDSPEAIYGSAFFPWPKPVSIVEGQTICVDLEAKMMEQDYFWRWNTKIAEGRDAGENSICFEQSQLQGAVVSLAKLHKTASDFVPQLSADGMIRRRALELMDGHATLESISRQLAADFPQQFQHWHKALSYAAAISKDNSR